LTYENILPNELRTALFLVRGRQKSHIKVDFNVTTDSKVKNSFFLLSSKCHGWNEIIESSEKFPPFFRGSAAALADSQILRISQRMITSLTDLKTNPANNW
jgi:hypothetical protein